MTPCPSLPSQSQSVSVYFHAHSTILYISPHIPHDTLSITTCTTTVGKYSISCTFYCTCTLYISPHILYDTLSITTCTTTAGKQVLYFHAHSTVHIHCISLLTSFMTPRPSQPVQRQEVSTLFLCTFYCTCTLYISPHIPHDTLSITTCTTTAGKYSIFMHILLYYIQCISLLTSPMTPCPSLPAQPQLVSTLFSCTFYYIIYIVYLSSHPP